MAQSDRTAKLLLCVTDKRVKRSNLVRALGMINGFLCATAGIFRDTLSRDSGPVFGFGDCDQTAKVGRVCIRNGHTRRCDSFRQIAGAQCAKSIGAALSGFCNSATQCGYVRLSGFHSGRGRVQIGASTRQVDSVQSGNSKS
ncbi:hypothetical protein [Burkholderia cepacia]|uniref:hypothetical protein n=1 Tax=Burkholderia cepacia TaxID=292 RepID=UPI00075E0709|nr:hypothetical protein [Burkholderia cepacia]KVX59328.1 hypothetical protein WL06_05860 [Burkholderia cepacia]KWD63388.1 hypothetical protein WL68_00475 [Burkholderia cepacia]KWD84418.1 hypothetical protein WL69_12740 [Burkholderia cepacia]